MIDTFGGKEDETLEKLNIFSQKTLVLEIKKPNEQFVEYDDEMMNL